MVNADSHVVWNPFNKKGPKRRAFCSRDRINNSMLLGRDSWRKNTTHVYSFVFISILRGQPRTPPSGDNICILDYHLKIRR